MTQVTNLEAVAHFGHCQAHVYAALISIRNSPDAVSRAELTGRENDLNKVINALSTKIKRGFQAAILAASKGAQAHEHINVTTLLHHLVFLYKETLDGDLQDALKSGDIAAFEREAKSILDLTGETLKSAGEDYAKKV